MTDDRALSPLEAMARKRARLLEEAAAVERDMADLKRIAAKYDIDIPLLPLEPNVPASVGVGGRTVADVAKLFSEDPRSPIHGLRYRTRENYEDLVRRIVASCGDRKLADLKSKDFEDLHSSWSRDGAAIAIAHSLITRFRGLVHFGEKVLQDGDCERLSVVLHNLRFPTPRGRSDVSLTRDQAKAIIDKAHERGHPSVALAQAFQFDCKLAQKDVIGEWVPREEPGVSEILHADMKWVRGLRWSEISDDLILRHSASRGGRTVEIDLSKAPLVMTELTRMGARPQSGAPVVISETTTRPYQGTQFRRTWRIIASAAGVPKNIKNMDSRAGKTDRATEASSVAR